MRLTLLSLGSQVRELRQKSTLTQEELAKKAGVSREWLNSVENGKVTVEFSLLLDLLSTLGYSLLLEKSKATPNANGENDKQKNRSEDD